MLSSLTTSILFVGTIFCVSNAQVQHVRIGAFNVQRLGGKKFSNDYVTDYLVKIIGRYDIILVQEVQDPDRAHIPGFVDKLTEGSGKPFAYVVSQSLGRKSYKEQYLYIYRTDVFEIEDSFHYDDGSEELGEDTFMREPFIILAKSTKTSVPKFALVGAHIQPKAVQQELDEMFHVHESVIDKWGNVPVAIMGDFNAGGSYLSNTKLKKLEMIKDKKFHWLLHNVDTTVGKNEYTYDRIIITGQELLESIVPDSATVFNYEEVYGLTKDEAKSISDHYPVEFVMGPRLMPAPKEERFVISGQKETIHIAEKEKPEKKVEHDGITTKIIGYFWVIWDMICSVLTATIAYLRMIQEKIFGFVTGIFRRDEL